MTPEQRREDKKDGNGAPPIPSDLGSLLSELKAAIQAEDKPSLALAPGSSLRSAKGAAVASAVLELCEMKHRASEIRTALSRTLGGKGAAADDKQYVKPTELVPGIDMGECKIIAKLVSEGILEEGFKISRGSYGNVRRESLGFRVRDEMLDAVRRLTPGR